MNIVFEVIAAESFKTQVSWGVTQYRGVCNSWCCKGLCYLLHSQAVKVLWTAWHL